MIYLIEKNDKPTICKSLQRDEAIYFASYDFNHAYPSQHLAIYHPNTVIVG